MSLKSWWRGWKEKRRRKSASEDILKRAPLREFVYLDAVSLHSLLVSQKETIPENISEAITRADEAELKSGVSVDGVLAKADTAARYQTSNSNNVQSSRKAVIQTLFKEFRDLPLDFTFAPTADLPKPLPSRQAIAASDDPTISRPGTALTRGTLIEIEVTLAVDPVFRLGTMMTEWTAMVDDYPAMAGSPEMMRVIDEAQPVMKVLNRFLAGLIPIKATATNYVVTEIAGKQYVVHQSAVTGLNLPVQPLRVVGVTEHLGYWKDIRRVLFSEGRFTMLCRIARDGIHPTWTPVKLADVFSEIAPDLVEQINAIQQLGPGLHDSADPQPHTRSPLSEALMAYKEQLVTLAELQLPDETETEVEAAVARLERTAGTGATTQRDAFDAVRAIIIAQSDLSAISPEADLQARQQARSTAGLALFPPPPFPKPVVRGHRSGHDEQMIDVEIIAIYWQW